MGKYLLTPRAADSGWEKIVLEHPGVGIKAGRSGRYLLVSATPEIVNELLARLDGKLNIEEKESVKWA